MVTISAQLVFYLLCFLSGFFLGFLLGYVFKRNFRKKNSEINQEKFIKTLITLLVALAWTGSIVVELIDRSFSTNFLLHLIMGMLVGGVIQVDFSNVLSSFSKVQITNNQDNGNEEN